MRILSGLLALCLAFICVEQADAHHGTVGGNRTVVFNGVGHQGSYYGGGYGVSQFAGYGGYTNYAQYVPYVPPVVIQQIPVIVQQAPTIVQQPVYQAPVQIFQQPSYMPQATTNIYPPQLQTVITPTYGGSNYGSNDVGRVIIVRPRHHH